MKWEVRGFPLCSPLCFHVGKHSTPAVSSFTAFGGGWGRAPEASQLQRPWGRSRANTPTVPSSLRCLEPWHLRLCLF